jgi:hypothetical protein
VNGGCERRREKLRRRRHRSGHSGLQIFAPVFAAHDIDGGVIHAWVPSAMVGGGVAF